MTREEIYQQCVEKIAKTNCLLMELATGTGKSRLSIMLTNYLLASKWYKDAKQINILILVAKRVHKQTWKDEIEKWGGIHHPTANINICMECYESLKNHCKERWDIVLGDECFRGDTEILTDSGYKQFKDLTENDLVAQFTSEGNIEFVKPLRLIKRQHTGEICKLHLGRERYCYLTPNHNMVYKTPWVEGWRMKPVKDLCKNCKTRIPVSGKGTGNNLPLTALERLFIAVQADGSLQRHQINESVYSISVKKDRKKARLRDILSELDNWSKIKENRGLDRYLVKLPKGDTKLLSTHFDVNMGYERANEFIEEVIQWDGCTKIGKGLLYYSSKEKANADFVSAIAVQAGYKVLNSTEKDDRQENYSSIHRVYMRRVEDVDTQHMDKEYLPYNDYVYCVEVPTHMIVVRSEGYTFIAGNCHHLGSELRLDLFKTVSFGYFIGLSATIPQKLKQLFKYRYHSEVVSCDIVEAIEDDILPEPQILLFPLMLDNRNVTEKLELHPKASGPIVYAEYKDIRKYKYKSNVHAIISCTQKQKVMELDHDIAQLKSKAQSSSPGLKMVWLHRAGQRLEYLADIKMPIIKDILRKLSRSRTITFCKSIPQAEALSKHCIHSKNAESDQVYKDFNAKKINHISTVNILNENANLVDCKYGIFCNLSSSEISVQQREGRLLRHKEPVMIIPYFAGTREEELAKEYIEGFKKIKVIHSIQEI